MKRNIWIKPKGMNKTYMINSEDQQLTSSELKLLDEIFCSNLAYRDEYIALAKKLGLNSYIELYEPLERGREI